MALVGVVLAQQPAPPSTRPERLPQDTGAAGLNQALKKLKTTARLLQITAHPDDEDGGMLTYQSRGQGAKVMLLTLTRGDGGQNKTGSNLFDELGVLRTLELVESDRYYGVEQRFTRVADFGFTKSADETFQKWGGREVVLADMVRVIRTFRPDVVAAGWSGTARDGHGQHQAAGILTPEAVRAAADPKRFPEQVKEGLHPWQVKKLYSRTRGDDYTLRFEAGKVDPNLGTSYAQFGILGYSQQKSQNASYFPANPGPNYRSYKLVDSALPAAAKTQEQDFFDGIDTTLPGLAGGLGAEESKVSFLRTDLKQIEANVDEAMSTRAAAPLLQGWERLRDVVARVEQSSLTPVAKQELLTHLRSKSEQFEEAAQLALGIGLHVTRPGGSQLIVPGERVQLNPAFEISGKTPVKLKRISLELPRGWNPVPAKDYNVILKAGHQDFGELQLAVPTDAKLTRPYWHRDEPDKQNVHAIDDPEFLTLPFPPSPIKARAVYEVSGITGELNVFATAEASGKRTPLAVVPAFSVLMRHGSQVVPVGRKAAINADMLVRSNLDQKVDAVVRLKVPAGWKAEPALSRVTFQPGEGKIVPFKVTPGDLQEKRSQVLAELSFANTIYSEGFSVVTRQDLDTSYYYQPAVQKVSVVRVELPKHLKVGYIMGAGDDILPALQQLGLDARLITPEELATGNLGQFNTIVLGIRAYDARDDARQYNQRLLEFVNQGGTLIVQYNSDREVFNSGNFGPFPLEINRQRVSVEDAPVEILAPADRLFNFPNKISASDFDGWIQERGLYFSTQWDEKYQPLLSTADPGEAPSQGGLLRAAHGKGTYIYTGYAFFRQIPAGVPGAIRLYVNLLSAGQVR